MGVVKKIFGGRALAIYLGMISFCSLAMGSLLDLTYKLMAIQPAVVMGKASDVLPYGVELTAALILAALLARSLFKRQDCHCHDHDHDHMHNGKAPMGKDIMTAGWAQGGSVFHNGITAHKSTREEHMKQNNDIPWQNLFPMASDIPESILKDLPCIQTQYLINGEIRNWDGPRQEVLSPVWVATDEDPSPFFYRRISPVNTSGVTAGTGCGCGRL